ncbi:MAG TPA: hypothetical protein VFK13_13815 [Gemmatimonadaceae bacterium]|nr:hypothetical protein [Gemmatimonadaceae bacterium]
MPTRSIVVNGRRWLVRPSGRITQYDRDEFSLMFVHEEGGERQVRVTRYSPMGARWRDQSLAEQSDDDLRRLFEMSQPAATSPEAGYAS